MRFDSLTSAGGDKRRKIVMFPQRILSFPFETSEIREEVGPSAPKWRVPLRASLDPIGRQSIAASLLGDLDRELEGTSNVSDSAASWPMPYVV